MKVAQAWAAQVIHPLREGKSLELSAYGKVFDGEISLVGGPVLVLRHSDQVFARVREKTLGESRVALVNSGLEFLLQGLDAGQVLPVLGSVDTPRHFGKKSGNGSNTPR